MRNVTVGLLRVLLGACLFVACTPSAATKPPSLSTSKPSTYEADLQSCGHAVSPTSAEVEAHILRLQKDNPALVKVEISGKTLQGRPLYVVTVTDPAVNDREKQNVFITAGQHGNEESGRMIALATLDWLVSPEAATTLHKQKIVVMPNVNPDGAELDMHYPPSGAKPNLDHGPDGPKCPEAVCTEKVAYALQPDLYIDLHSRGTAGCSYDMILWPKHQQYTEDDNVIGEIATEMSRAGEKAGVQNICHSMGWSGWGYDGKESNTSTTWFMYRKFKSMVVLTETCESNGQSYPDDVRVKSGLARIKTLLGYGNRTMPGFYYEGYPTFLIGMRNSGMMAVGTDADQRRASRVALWKNMRSLRPFADYPEQLKTKSIHMVYKGEAITAGVGLLHRCGMKMDVESVTLNGKPLSPSPTDGYFVWQDDCSTNVVIAMKGLVPGRYDIQIKLK